MKVENVSACCKGDIKEYFKSIQPLNLTSHKGRGWYVLTYESEYLKKLESWSTCLWNQGFVWEEDLDHWIDSYSNGHFRLYELVIFQPRFHMEFNLLSRIKEKGGRK